MKLLSIISIVNLILAFYMNAYTTFFSLEKENTKTENTEIVSQEVQKNISAKKYIFINQL